MFSNISALRNFLTPRWIPFISSVLTVGLILVSVEDRIESLWLRILKIENIFVGDPSYVAYRAHRDENIGLKTVVMIGGSVTREASLLDNEMEQLFYANSGLKIQFLNLGSSDQSLLESAAIIKTLNLKPGSIVFIQISFKKLIYSRKDFRADYFGPRMAMLDYSMLNNFLGYSDIFMHFITPKIILYRNPLHNLEKEKNCGHIGLLLASSSCYVANSVVRHKYEQVVKLSVDEKSKLVENIKNTTLPSYLKNSQFSSDVLQEIVTYLKEIDAIPIFIEYPVSDIEKPLDIKIRRETDYRQKISALSTDIRYLDWVFDSDFNEEDFCDLQHMFDSGKRKLSKKLLHYVEINYFK